MKIKGYHEINFIKNEFKDGKNRIHVETVADFTGLDFLVTRVDTSRISLEKFTNEMLRWPEVRAVHEAAEKLAKRLLQEIEQ